MNAREHLLPYARRADFHVGRATELSGSDYRLYRFLEILPGALSWFTLVLICGVIFRPCVLYFLAFENRVYVDASPCKLASYAAQPQG